MMMSTFGKHILLAAALLTPGAAAAAVADDTPGAEELVYTLGAADQVYGTGQAEAYEVALRITEPELVGAQVAGLRIPMRGSAGISGMRAWITEELTLGTVDGRRVTVPDVASVAVEPAAGYVEVRFDQPYTIPATGLYAGYTFFVDEVSTALFTEQPVMVTSHEAEDGFYLHTSRTFRVWTNVVETYGYVTSLAMQVILCGDVLPADAARLTGLLPVYTTVDSQSVAELTVANRGTQGIASVQVAYELDGQRDTVSVGLPVPVAAVYDASAEVQVPLPAVTQTGTCDLHVSLVGVNGRPNAETAATSADGTVGVYAELPRHRAVLEEYTGLWCSFCPRGTVALEEMKRLHPDDFIGVSYHAGTPSIDLTTYAYEPMQFTTEFSTYVASYPLGWIDRMLSTDPFCGSSTYRTFGIERIWQWRCREFAPAWVDVSAQFSADGSTLDVNATLRFVIDLDDHPYQLAYLLVADSLYSDDWLQNNAYVGDTGWPSCMDEYVGGTQWMSVAFHDVAIARSSRSGIEGSLPQHIEAFQPVSHTWQFNLAEVQNLAGEPLLPADVSRLHVVALLIDSTTGEIVNANQVWPGQSTGISAAPAAAPAARRAVNLQGQRVQRSWRGITIIDGRKTIVR